jgi:glycogen debranching enzyme
VLEDRVILKEDQVFAVTDVNGDAPAGNDLGLGLYREDTRYLSASELRINGRLPILLNHAVDRAYVATFQLVNPALSNPDGTPIPRQSLSIRRTRFVHDLALHERVGIQNCHTRTAEFELEYRFDADFLDIFAVRGYHPRATGKRLAHEVTETGLKFGYEGADGLLRRTEVVFDPVPELTPGVARLRLRLEPHQTFVLLVDTLTLCGDERPSPGFEFDASLSDLERTYERWNSGCTGYRTDNEVLDNGLLWRSLEDLRILCDRMPTGLYPTAGTPWYAVPFGRDALITSFQTLALNPELAYGTLRYLALNQGTRIDPYREEEPGKILHESRFGELARLHEIPHTPYYGTVDATPLFLVLLVELLDWTGDVDLLSELMPNVFAALEWIDRYGDLDEDGLVEYTQRSTLGVRNQGWKDSWDSLTGADGEPAPLPAALVEVQGYVYHAKSGLARILRGLGQAQVADKLHREAEVLRQRFEELFWMPERGFYAQALDRDKRQVTSIASNAGHALWSGIADAARARAVASRLVAPDMFSGWGVRTLSADEPNFNPMSYHNGTIWPHDNSLIVAGMRRYGFREEPELVARSVLEACMHFTDDRLPELFCGFTRDRRFNSGPGEYLVSCSPQAWAAGALFHFLQVLCGVDVDSFGRRLRIDPLATPLYDRIRVEGMRVAGGELDFTVDRDGGTPRVRVDRSPKGLELELPS